MNIQKLLFAFIATSLLVGAVSIEAADNIPTNGLIGCWLGDGNASDSSPVANHGSFEGSFAPSPIGQAFDLATGKFSASHKDAYDFRSYDGWSVGFWFNGNGSEINAGNGLFLGQDEGAGFHPKWFINYGYTVYDGNNCRFSFHVNDDNQERIFVTSDCVPSTKLIGWNQLTVTINNTNSGTVNFYLNGLPIGSGAMGGYVLRARASLMFGQAEGFRFTGLMSGVVIYDRVLLGDEIRKIATVPKLVITKQPVSVSVATGGTVSFSVGVTGPGPVKFQWRVNGINIQGATNATLTLANISAPAVGVYSVAVTHASGDLVSDGATLTTVDVRMFAGVVVNGVLGTNYAFRSSSLVAGSEWILRTNVTLATVPYIYIDYSSVSNSKQFYEVLSEP